MTRKTKAESIEIVRGSGNVFRDFNDPNPDLEQLRAILAARIIKVLDARKLSVRKAHELTGGAAADFSRIRQAKVGRFTIDRLMSILNRLDQEVEVSVNVHPRTVG
jgi:predicted XRE-type DNA-binding protein